MSDPRPSDPASQRGGDRHLDDKIDTVLAAIGDLRAIVSGFGTLQQEHGRRIDALETRALAGDAARLADTTARLRVVEGRGGEWARQGFFLVLGALLGGVAWLLSRVLR